MRRHAGGVPEVLSTTAVSLQAREMKHGFEACSCNIHLWSPWPDVNIDDSVVPACM
jgi:hypothetical protein